MTTDLETKPDTQTETELPDGFVHLYDDVYRVRWDLIEFADDGFDLESTVFKYQNPRHIRSGNRIMGKGGSKEEMDDLREAIRTEGLKHPLDCRWLPGRNKVQLVGGSRRNRCIHKLRQNNDQCWNPASKAMEPAQQVYESIVCHVNEMDDKTALKHAVSSNEQSKTIGEGALVALVRHLRNCQQSDQEILWALSKSPSWLKEADEILTLDKKTFDSFCNEEINRTVALKLSRVSDTKHRLEILGAAIKMASARIAADLKRHDDQIEKAKEEQDLAEGEAEVAKHVGKNPAPAQKKVRAARHKIDVHEKAKDEIRRKRTGKVTTKDLEGAVAATGHESEETPAKRPLTPTKVKQTWLERIKTLIKSNGKGDDGTDLEIPMDDLYFAKTLLEGWLSGEESVEKIFKQVARNRERRRVKK